MADIRQTLILKVKAKDVDKLKTALEDVDVEIGRVSKSSGALDSNLKKIGTRAKAAIAGVLLAALTAVAAAMAKAAKAAIDFEVQMAQVATLVDTTTVNMDFLKDGLLRIAAAIPETIENLTAALYQTVSAGIDAGEALNVVEVAAKAAKAGATDTKTAVDGITTALNAWGISTERAIEVSDAFFVAVRDGKTTFGELSSSIGAVAPIASQLGVSLDEVLAATAAMTKGGIVTTEAMTAIRGALVAVIKQTDNSKNAAKELGIEFNAASLKALKLQGFIKMVGDAAGGNAETLQALFGRIQGLTAMMSLAGEQADDLAAGLANMDNKAGSTNTAFAKMEETGSEMAELLKSKLNVAFTELGSVILPSVIATLGYIIDLMEQFGTDAEKRLAILQRIGASPVIILEAKLNVDVETLNKQAAEAEAAFKDAAENIGHGFLDLNYNIEQLRREGLSTLRSELLDLDTDSIEAMEELRTRIAGVVMEGEKSATVNKILGEQVLFIDAVIRAKRMELQTDKLRLEVGDKLINVNRAIAEGITEIGDANASGLFDDLKEAINQADVASESVADFKAMVTEAFDEIRTRARDMVRKGIISSDVFNDTVRLLQKMRDEARKTAGAVGQGTEDELKRRQAAEKLLIKLLATNRQREESEAQLSNRVAEGVTWMKEALDLNTKILALEKIMSSLSEKDQQTAQDLVDTLKTQRDLRAEQSDEFQGLLGLVEEMVRGTSKISAEMLKSFDPVVFAAALDDIGNLVTKMLSDLDAKVEWRVLVNKEDRATVLAEVEATKEAIRQRFGELGTTLFSVFQSLGDEIQIAFGETLASLTPEAKTQVDEILRVMRESISEAERKLQFGEITRGQFDKAVAKASKTATTHFEKMLVAGKLTKEEMDNLLLVIKEIADAAGDSLDSFERFAESAAGLGSIVSGVGALANAIGMIGDEANKSIQDVAKLITAVGELSNAISTITNATTTGATLGGVGAALGAAAGIAGALGSLFSRSGPSQGQIQADAAQASRELAKTMRDAARDIGRAVDRLTASMDTSGNQFNAFEAAIDSAEKSIAAIDPNDWFRVLKIKLAMDGLLTAIEDLDLEGVDVDLYRSWVDAMIESGDFTMQEIFDMLMNGGEGLEFGLNDLGDKIGATFGASVEEANRRLSFFSQFLGEGQEAAKDYADFLLNNVQDLPASITDILERISSGDIDVSTAAGQAELNAAITEVARLYSTGAITIADLGGLTEAQFLSILASLDTLGIDIEDKTVSIGEKLSAAGQAAADWLQFVDPTDIQGAFDAWIHSMISTLDKGDPLEPLIRSISGLNINTAEGQAELDAIIDRIGRELATQGSTWQEALGMTEEEFRRLAGELGMFVLPEIEVDPISKAIASAGQAMRDFRQFVSDDAQGAFDVWLREMRNMSDEIGPAGKALLDSLGGIEIDTEAGQAELNNVITAIGTILSDGFDEASIQILQDAGLISESAARMIEMGGMTLAEALGLSEQELRAIAGDLNTFRTDGGIEDDGGVDDIADPVREATNALRLFTRFLNDDANVALAKFTSDLLRTVPDMSPELTKLLQEAATLDLKSAGGQEQLQAIMASITRGLFHDVDFGIPDDQVEAILNQLAALGKTGESQGAEFSRSVQSIRTITEIEADELVTGVNSLVWYVRRIYEQGIADQRSRAGDSFSIPTFDIDEIVRGIDAQRVATFDTPIMPSSSVSNEYTFDFDITTQPNVDSILIEVERAIRKRLFQTFKR